MSGGVKRGSECEVLGQAWWVCYAKERGRGCEAVGRTVGKKREAADRAGLGLALMLDLISIS